MAEQTLSTRTMLTAFFSTAPMETAARQTGFVQRASNMTGKILLALVTCGGWSDAKTPFAHRAAHVTPLDEHSAVSPEAIDQRLHTRAIALLQEMLRQARATVQAVEHRCEAGLCRFCTAV